MSLQDAVQVADAAGIRNAADVMTEQDLLSYLNYLNQLDDRTDGQELAREIIQQILETKFHRPVQG